MPSSDTRFSRPMSDSNSDAPSAAQLSACGMARPLAGTSLSAPLRGSASHIPGLPPRADRKAIRLPSGDQRGKVSSNAPAVSWRRCFPSAETIHTCHMPSA